LTTTRLAGAAGFFNHNLTVPPGGWILKNPAFPSLDPTAGFTLGFQLALTDEGHSTVNRAGFSVIVIGDDLNGIELGFWKDRIWAQSGPDFVQAEGAAVSTIGVTSYVLTIHGTSYTLRADGSEILTGPTRDYTSATPTPDPYDTPGMLFLGDDTRSASANFFLGSIQLETPATEPVPEPSTFLLLGAGLGGLALWRNRKA
jgi:hypothetical protein